jgi:hypothetical protein
MATPEVSGRVLVLRPEVVATVIEQGAVLLNLDTNDFYEVNASGWAIVKLFEGGATREQVMERCAQWGAPADDGAVARFLEVLIGDVLVAPSEWPAASGDDELNTAWSAPTIEKSPEALQRIVRSPFDPTLPLAE